MQKHLLKNCSRVVLLIAFLSLISLTLYPDIADQNKTMAGTAIFPADEVGAWERTQNDSRIDDLDKAVETINQFFQLKFKSLVKDQLYDFGFLFDLSNKLSLDDYLYERGFQYLTLVGQQAWGNHYLSYDYRPKILDVKYHREGIRIGINPDAEIVHSFFPEPKTSGPWTYHVFEMVDRNGHWLINRVSCPDQLHNIYPRNMDFNEKAKKVRREIEAFKKNEESHRGVKIKRKDSAQLFSLQQGQYRTFRKYECQWYARQYSSTEPGASSYNPLFISFVSDCQNFVSQCLWWGYLAAYASRSDMQTYIDNHYLPMVDNIENAITWWCDSAGMGSYTIGKTIKYCWTIVGDFIYMITQNNARDKIGLQGSMVIPLLSLRIGDIVKIKTESHIMIISDIIDYDRDGNVDYNEIFVCAHTTNRKDKLLYDLNHEPTTFYFYCIWCFLEPA